MVNRPFILNQPALSFCMIASRTDQQGFALNFAMVKDGIEVGLACSTADYVQSRAFTMERMIQYERDNVAGMQRGQGQNGPLLNPQTWQHVRESHAHLSPSQRAAVEQIVSGPDKIVGLRVWPGLGKKTSLSAIREAAE
jgi:hypothetical protein